MGFLTKRLVLVVFFSAKKWKGDIYYRGGVY